MRKPSLSFTVVAALLALGCQKDLTTPGGGGGPNSMVAQVTATDVSRPTGPDATPVDIAGTVTFTGVTVELWNGTEWLSVAKGSGSASVKVGDGTASATLVPASEIPAGDYTKARFSATNAAVDVTLNGQSFSARVGNPSLGPIEIEKTVSVSVNPDGSRTFSIELEMIRSVSLRGGINGPVVEISGDLGAMSVPASAAPGMVSATDVSQPVDARGAPVNVSGTVSFTGLSVELWDGSRWLSVVDGAGSADVTIGDGAASATLVPATAIAAGEYSKVRIAAKETVAQLTATIDGQEVAAQLRVPSDRPFVVEKAVTVTVNADGSRTFSVQLELVRTVDVSTDPITGAPRLDVTGELVGR